MEESLIALLGFDVRASAYAGGRVDASTGARTGVIVQATYRPRQ